MDKRLLWGVLVPSIFAIIFVILGALGIGYSVQNEFVDSVAFEDLFRINGEHNPDVKIFTIRSYNDFFIPSKYRLQVISVCLIDLDGNVKSDSFNIRRSPANKNQDIPAYGTLEADILIVPKYTSSIEEYEQYDELAVFVSEDLSLYDEGRGYITSYSGCEGLILDHPESIHHIPLIFE